ncbi:MAG: transcription termination/antitermination protein NusG, partial [Sphingomonas sp.]|uniref:transcription termination/antitermination protein NusG n=1 Tax=Sphingomonas sp. TaxID=28214 RepID=UPI003F32858E
MTAVFPPRVAAIWHVVQAQPHRETRAAQELENQGFRTFLPCCLRRRRHARQTSMVSTPLFPGYLFVAFDVLVQRWRSINGTVGVVRLVTAMDCPLPIARGVVEGLMARRDADGYIPLPTRDQFARGDVVRVAEGSFADALGLFEEVKDHDRIAILLDLLGRKVRVLIDGALV